MQERLIDIHIIQFLLEKKSIYILKQNFLDNMHGSSIESFMKSLFKKGVNEEELNSVEKWVKDIKKDE